MPRPRGPRTRNKTTPLYRLRKAIGGDHPISQPTFAELVGAALPTLKWLGNRRMSSALLEKIRSATGAEWNADRKRWEFQGLPYTREIFLSFQSFLEAPLPTPRRRHLAEATACAVQLLLDMVSDSRFNAFRFHVWRAIFEWKKQFGISGKIVLGGRTMTEEEFEAGSEGKEETIELTESLEKLRPAFAIECDPQTGKPKSFTEMEGYCLPAFADRLIVDPSKATVSKPAKAAKRGGSS